MTVDHPVFSPVGERGPTGDAGSDGLRGEAGFDGLRGVRGEIGHDGPPGTPAPPPVSDRWERRLKLLAYLMIGAIVLISLTVTIRSQNETSGLNDLARDNSERIEALTLELVDTKSVITDADRCTLALTGVSRNATRDYFAALGDVIVVIATVVPEEREAALGDVIEALDNKLLVYRLATDQLTAWQLLAPDRQTVCPVSTPTK